jgi:hypothetical protein
MGKIRRMPESTPFSRLGLKQRNSRESNKIDKTNDVPVIAAQRFGGWNLLFYSYYLSRTTVV